MSLSRSSQNSINGINHRRLPKRLQEKLAPPTAATTTQGDFVRPNAVYHGDARLLLSRIEPDSIPLSVWSPPYFVGKQYESHLTFDHWKSLLKTVITLHFPIITPGGFLVINIADILCFRDE